MKIIAGILLGIMVVSALYLGHVATSRQTENPTSSGSRNWALDTIAISIDLCKNGSILIRPGEAGLVHTRHGDIIIIRPRKTVKWLPDLELR